VTNVGRRLQVIPRPGVKALTVPDLYKISLPGHGDLITTLLFTSGVLSSPANMRTVSVAISAALSLASCALSGPIGARSDHVIFIGPYSVTRDSLHNIQYENFHYKVPLGVVLYNAT
jgi:hypothetical protein